MSEHAAIGFPKGALIGAAALISVALLAAVSVRSGLVPEVANPQAMRADASVAVVSQRDLRFLDGADGSVLVRDVSGALVTTIDPSSEQGFVRGALRGLARERRLRDAAADAPFRLALWADGGLTLTDLATGRQIELGSFGPTNRAAFAVMLPGGTK